MYLLDTNACIDFLLFRNKSVHAKIDKYFASLSVSTVTVAELRVGSKASGDPEGDDRRLDVFLSAIAVEAFSANAADRYGDIVREVGVERKSFDRLIAAHAIALGRPLVTNNEQDFQKIPGLIVENWATK